MIVALNTPAASSVFISSNKALTCNRGKLSEAATAFCSGKSARSEHEIILLDDAREWRLGHSLNHGV